MKQARFDGLALAIWNSGSHSVVPDEQHPVTWAFVRRAWASSKSLWEAMGMAEYLSYPAFPTR